jgi:hypothetical protein
MTLKSHVREVVRCRRTGHLRFLPDRKTRVVAGKPYTYKICAACGTGVDPRPMPATERVSNHVSGPVRTPTSEE